MKKYLPLCVLVSLTWQCHAQDSQAPLWDIDSLSNPPQVFAAPAQFTDSPAADELPEGVKAICFEGLPWRGKPTRVFALLGLPAGADSAHPVPGIVLVHGAGGTAFGRWVKQWMDRGYAAIAIDTDGGIPVGTYSHWERNPDGDGPPRQDIPQLKWPQQDQWMYHAVANTILAHSLLASLPGVDPDRIGVTGISWGGVIISNAVGVDPRFKFAIPVYGCGFIGGESEDGSTFVGKRGTPAQRAQWSELWDPAQRLPQATVPMLWVAGTNDFAFTMRAWQSSYEAAPGTQAVSLHLRLPHSQGTGEKPAEIGAFADSIVKDAPPLPHFEEQGRSGSSAWAKFSSPTPIASATLYTTSGTGRWQDREWQPSDTRWDASAGQASAQLPEGTTVYFFNVTDSRGLTVSSPHQTLSD